MAAFNLPVYECCVEFIWRLQILYNIVESESAAIYNAKQQWTMWTAQQRSILFYNDAWFFPAVY